MSDLISRQMALNEAYGVVIDGERFEVVQVETLLGLPSAEPKRGEWVNARDGYKGHVKCTSCFKTYDFISQAQYYNFCPNCGADMRGESDD